MGIGLIAFDLDGTAIVDHKYLSEGNRRALCAAAGQGVHLLPASGRMRDFLPEAITSLPGVRYAVTANGAAVYDLQTGGAVYKRCIPNEKVRQVQKVLDGYDIYIEYYENGSAITQKGFPEMARTHFRFPKSKWHFVDSKDYRLAESFGALAASGIEPEKINLPFLSPGDRQEIRRRLEALGGLRVTSSIPDNLEINAGDADKGSAVLAVAHMLGLARENVLALGDNGNDVTMLKAAGVSAAMGDGSREAIEAAAYTTAPHDQDGVAEAIYRFVLPKKGSEAGVSKGF